MKASFSRVTSGAFDEENYSATNEVLHSFVAVVNERRRRRVFFVSCYSDAYSHQHETEGLAMAIF